MICEREKYPIADICELESFISPKVCKGIKKINTMTTSFTCVGWLWRTRYITIVAILVAIVIQWDANKWQGILQFSKINFEPWLAPPFCPQAGGQKHSLSNTWFSVRYDSSVPPGSCISIRHILNHWNIPFNQPHPFHVTHLPHAIITTSSRALKGRSSSLAMGWRGLKSYMY